MVDSSQAVDIRLLVVVHNIFLAFIQELLHSHPSMIWLRSRELEFELTILHFIAVAWHAQPTTFQLLHFKLLLSTTWLEAKHIIRPRHITIIEVPMSTNYFNFVVLKPSIEPIELFETIASSAS